MKAFQTLKLNSYNDELLSQCNNVESRFVCCFCNEIYFVEERLKEHFISFHGYKTIDQNKSSPKTCNICKTLFKNSKTLSKHVKNIHKKLKSFKCSVCSKQFSRKATLDIHIKIHLSDDKAKTLPCLHPNCAFKAADPSVLAKHWQLHQDSNKGKYKCPAKNCNYFAIQATGLKNHISSKHIELYADLKCPKPSCKFVSINPDRLRKHMNDHEKGLLDVKEDTKPIEPCQKYILNSEISSDCSLPIESCHLDTGGVTIIHNNSINHVDSDDTVF